jgi:chromosome segregation ATPase
MDERGSAISARASPEVTELRREALMFIDQLRNLKQQDYKQLAGKLERELIEERKCTQAFKAEIAELQSELRNLRSTESRTRHDLGALQEAFLELQQRSDMKSAEILENAITAEGVVHLSEEVRRLNQAKAHALNESDEIRRELDRREAMWAIKAAEFERQRQEVHSPTFHHSEILHSTLWCISLTSRCAVGPPLSVVSHGVASPYYICAGTGCGLTLPHLPRDWD